MTGARFPGVTKRGEWADILRTFQARVVSHSITLITGATGFIGRRLVPALCARGTGVRVLTRDMERAAATLPPSVSVMRGDLLEPASVHAACRGVTTVIHLAASVPAPGASGSTVATNVVGTATLARAAAEAGVERFVHGSSAGVYGDGLQLEPHREDAPLRPGTEYERSKAEAERTVVDAFGGRSSAWTILRIAGVYGPGRPATAAFIRTVLARRVWIHGPVRVLIHPTYVDDVVQAIVRALDAPAARGRIFNVAGSRAMSYPALIDSTARLLGTRVRHIAIPTALGRAASLPLSWSSRAAGWPSPDRIAVGRAGLINRTLDISRAQRDLGFVPAPFEESTADTIAWFRQQGAL